MIDPDLKLDRDGAERLAGAARDVLPGLMAVAGRTEVVAGARLQGDADLIDILGSDGAIGRIAAARQGSAARPVRAILFDKSPHTNWGLGWHQDRTIAVRARREVPGFGPWTVKRGMPHVAPPIELLERMLTIRVHLDDVPVDNAPLLVAPGSHRLGRIAEDQIAAVVRDVESGNATPRPATSGSTPPLSCMHRKPREGRAAAVFSRSTMPPMRYLTVLNGLGFEGSRCRGTSQKRAK
jgi:hypothetical protein